MGRSAAVLLALLTAACAGETMVVRESPSLIELRWQNGSDRLDRAELIAAAHCAQYGKRSSFGSMFRDRDVSLATFQCLGPSARGSGASTAVPRALPGTMAGI